MEIVVTQFDYDRLTRLLSRKQPHSEYEVALASELERAEVVEAKDVPPDVITMNSHIRFTDDHGDKWEYWLVFPEDADLVNHRISILSPIGCALLGYKTGDEITIPTPLGRRVLKVQDIIHQPEREGQFDV